MYRSINNINNDSEILKAIDVLKYCKSTLGVCTYSQNL